MLKFFYRKKAQTSLLISLAIAILLILPSVFSGPASVNLEMTNYLWYDSSESALESENTAHTADGGTQFFLATEVQENGGANTNPDNYLLEVCACTSTSDCSNCDATSATNWNAMAALSWTFWDSSFADNDAISSPTWASTFTSYEENGGTRSENLKNEDWEQRWTTQAPSPASATRYNFKLTNNGAELNTYTNVADVTINGADADVDPVVTLNTPADNAVDTDGNITFNCSATDDYDVVNLTLYHNISGTWQSNLSSDISGINGSAEFILNYTPAGKYIWNCEAADNGSQFAFASSNFTFIVPLATNLVVTEQTVFNNATYIIVNYSQNSNSQPIQKAGVDDAAIGKVDDATLFAVDNSGSEIWSYKEVVETGNVERSIAGDFDRDGRLDDIAYVHNGATDYLIVLNDQGTQIWNFTLDHGSVHVHLSAGDFNNDGFEDDIALVAGGGNYLDVFNGTGESLWNFTALGTGYDTSALEVGDFNNNGFRDNIAAGFFEDTASNNDVNYTIFDKDGNQLFGHLFTGVGRHRDFPSDIIEVVDLNGDGRDDLVFTDSDTQIIALNNSGSTLWSYTVDIGLSAGGTSWPASIEVADFDLDGRADDVVAVTQTPKTMIFFNNTGKNYKNVSSYATTRAITLLALDYNNDNSLNDLLYTGGTIITITNDSGRGYFNQSTTIGADHGGVGDLDNDGIIDDFVVGVDNYAVAFDSSGTKLYNFSTLPSNDLIEGRIPIADLDNDFIGCLITFDKQKTPQYMHYNKTQGLYVFEKKFFGEAIHNYTVNCTSYGGIYDTQAQTDNVTVDNTPPTISNLNATPNPANTSATINITATITDNVLLDTTLSEITFPNGTAMNFSMTASGSAYHLTFTQTQKLGYYLYRVYANDTGSNIVNTTQSNFRIDATPDLDLFRTQPGTVGINQTFSVQLKVTNNGTDFANVLSMYEFVPKNFTIIDDGGAGTLSVNASHNRLSFSLDQILVNETQTFSYTVQAINNGSFYFGLLTLNFSDINDNTYTKVEDGIPNTNVTAGPFIAFNLTPESITLSSETNLSFTINNSGENAADNINISLQHPLNWTINTATISDGGFYDSANRKVFFNLTTLAVGSSYTFSFNATPDDPYKKTFTSNATYDNGTAFSSIRQFDLDIASARITFAQTLPTATSPNLDNLVTINLSNKGTLPAYNITVVHFYAEENPAFWNVTNYTGDDVALDTTLGTLTWNITTLATDAWINFTYNVTALDIGRFTFSTKGNFTNNNQTIIDAENIAKTIISVNRPIIDPLFLTPASTAVGEYRNFTLKINNIGNRASNDTWVIIDIPTQWGIDTNFFSTPTGSAEWFAATSQIIWNVSEQVASDNSSVLNFSAISNTTGDYILDIAGNYTDAVTGAIYTIVDTFSASITRPVLVITRTQTATNNPNQVDINVTLKIDNSGNSKAAFINLTELFPDNFTLVNAGNAFNTTLTNTIQLNWSLDNISAGGTLKTSYLINAPNDTGAFNFGIANVTYEHEEGYFYAFNESSTTEMVVNDTRTPNITTNSPINDSTWTSSGTVTFGYIVDDFSTVSNCSLYIDGSLDNTDTSITKNTNQTLSKALSNGNYNWSINCSDALGYENVSGTYNISVNFAAGADETPPTWSNNATNASNSVKVNEYIWFSIQWDDETALNFSTFSVAPGTETFINQTNRPLNDSTQAVINETYQVNATRGQTLQWRWYANDSKDNKNNTDIWNITIANTLPTITNLSTPANASTITNRSPEFNWTPSFDADGDTITYSLVIRRISCSAIESCDIDFINISGIDTNSYVITQELDVDSQYNFTVHANDSTGYSNAAEGFNFTVDSFMSLSFPVTEVNFGSAVATGSINDTEDDNPAPIQIRNDGNTRVNLTVYQNATLWVRTYAGFNTSYFQFRPSNTSETGAFAWDTSINSFANMSNVTTFMMDALEYNDSYDSAELDLNISVPPDEPGGTKITGLIIESSITS